MRKMLLNMAVLGLLGLTAGQASANTISFAEGDTLVTGGASPITLTLQGNFDTTPVDGGDIIIYWADTFFDYGSITAVNVANWTVVTDPAANTAGDGSITGGQLLPGQEGIGMSLTWEGAGQAAGLWPLITISLDATNLPNGVFTDVIGMNDTVFGGWAASGVTLPDNATTYLPITVSVSAVPVPAAAWLMLSGLMGVVTVARRKHS
jgi:hypothetical protein